ncbi:MAG: VOC family protein [Halofilum sp. (in: g-proteobacteria)]|nr:VOC family protein [Halofilum sp. (in: g-proteobacteria)]
MPRATLDHLVVAANRLADGVRHVASALGIEPSPGGRHEYMNTHNAVLRLGPQTYLEIIAIDPDAGPADAPRWFDLDGRETRAKLEERPRLLTWVARCEDLEAVSEAAPWDTGPIRRMYRGRMTWRIAFPESGHLREQGLLPPLIEWDIGSTHPASRMIDVGCRLAAFRAHHPNPEDIRHALATIGLDTDLEISEGKETRLEAMIETPDGPRTLT